MLEGSDGSCRPTSRGEVTSWGRHSQTDIPFEIEVRVIDLLRAADLWRLVGVVWVDGEGEVESAAFVET